MTKLIKNDVFSCYWHTHQVDIESENECAVGVPLLNKQRTLSSPRTTLRTKIKRARKKSKFLRDFQQAATYTKMVAQQRKKKKQFVALSV